MIIITLVIWTIKKHNPAFNWIQIYNLILDNRDYGGYTWAVLLESFVPLCYVGLRSREHDTVIGGSLQK